MSEFVIIAGMSGAGRTQVANTLEDLGWFVIDNLPPSLIGKVAELAQGGSGNHERVALVVGSSGQHDEILRALNEISAAGTRVRVLFLNASTDALVARYESTKRRHPHMTTTGLAAAIDNERALLGEIRQRADLVIDTSNKSVHELRNEVAERFGDQDGSDQMQISLVSFGYKHGMPRDVDMVMDCRFLANPYWNEALRPLTGLDEPVIEFVQNLSDAEVFVERLSLLLELLIPAYREEGKSYLTIAFGCTGGRHRSVSMCERFGEILAANGDAPRVSHRDIGK